MARGLITYKVQTIQTMHTNSFTVTSPIQLEQLLTAEKQGGNCYQLAIVFASVKSDIVGLQNVFQKFDIRVCGCSTAGELVDGELLRDSITGILFNLPISSFTVWTGLYGAISSQAETIGHEAHLTYDDPHFFVLSGGLTIDGEDIINGLTKGVGKQINAFGGIGADDYNLERTFCFSESEISENGIVAVIFDGDVVKLTGNAISGWEPMGIENEITSVEGNVVHEINGRPALEFFNQFFETICNTGFSTTVATHVTSQYPIQIIRPEGNILRAPAMVHPNGTSIILAGGVRTGDQFRFSIAPGFEVIDQTVAFFKEDQVDKPNPDAVLMISCKGRHAAFGPMLEDEIEQIAALYQAPMAGFLSYGEIGAIDHKGAALHNDTCCVVKFNAV